MADNPKASGFPGISRASRDAARESPPSPEFAGYQIVDELPRGGQAIVYKAIHRATKTTVALKVLPMGLIASEAARWSFEREVELIAALNHPNIVRIRDSGIVQGQYYFAMEYIQGRDLARDIESRNMAFGDKMVLFRRICDGVTHAHQHGVIHRDLKPSNILVDEWGEPHIVDFGLAKMIGTEVSATQEAVHLSLSGEIKGTPAYMSPEQASGRGHQVDVRSDVYALGVILYQMLTGRFPYELPDSFLDVLEKVRSADPIRPRSFIRGFDRDAEAIIFKAMAKEPERRYQSVAELRQDVQCWIEGLPISVKSVSSVYLLRKIIIRHRYASAVMGLLVFIVLGFSCFSFSLYREAQRVQQESADLATKWAAEADHNLILSERVTFTCFLQAYHAAENDEARGISRFFAKDSKESKAATFLLDPMPLPEKETALRNGLDAKEGWFAEFTMGEYYQRMGEREKALDAYRRSQQGIQDTGVQPVDTTGWLVMLVQARIRKLSLPDGPAERPSSMQ